MTKTFSLTISLAVALVGFAAVAAPTQAANRLMSSTVDAFEFRCEKHDGIFASTGGSVNCQTPTVPVACDYFDDRQAVCEWPGILNQVNVIRVIGTLPAGYAADLSSGDGDALADLGNGGGNGGGFDGPKDISDVPDNDPKPGFDGPQDFVDTPNDDPKPGFDGPNDFKMAP